MVKICANCKAEFRVPVKVSQCSFCGGELKQPENIQNLSLPEEKKPKDVKVKSKPYNIAYR